MKQIQEKIPTPLSKAEDRSNSRLRVDVVESNPVGGVNEVAIHGTQSGLELLARQIMRIARTNSEMYIHPNHACHQSTICESEHDWWLTIGREKPNDPAPLPHVVKTESRSESSSIS